jgi:hypothetical protein
MTIVWWFVLCWLYKCHWSCCLESGDINSLSLSVGSIWEGSTLRRRQNSVCETLYSLNCHSYCAVLIIQGKSMFIYQGFLLYKMFLSLQSLYFFYVLATHLRSVGLSSRLQIFWPHRTCKISSRSPHPWLAISSHFSMEIFISAAGWDRVQSVDRPIVALCTSPG